MIVYKLYSGDTLKGSHLIVDKISSLNDEIELGDTGDTFVIVLAEMPEADYLNLPEFDGF